MEITFTCSECRGPLTCADDLAGKSVSCPHCKMNIAVPQTARAQMARFNKDNLEGWLRIISVLLLILIGCAILIRIASGSISLMGIFLASLVGVVQLFIFFWMAELLAAVKKMAGLRHNLNFSLMQYECTACKAVLNDRVTNCPPVQSPIGLATQTKIWSPSPGSRDQTAHLKSQFNNTVRRHMLDVTKSFVLQRRAVFSFGQDYRAQAVINKLGLVAVPCVDGLYRPPTAVPPRLVVSFNPHSAADARFIHDLPEDVRVVLHHQLQLSYLDVSQRAFLADCAQRAEVTVVPARFLETALQKELSPKRTRCIYNGVDTDVFRPSSASERQRYRAACGLPPEGLLIAAVGQLSKAKGVQALQRFVSMLPQNVCLVIRSLPTYKQELEELKATNPSRICIQVEDNQSRENLPTRYADLLLVLSLSEVAPMVCCEALVSGVPVITSRCTPFYDELETLGIGS
ncbi:MAG: glycosyltransferase, partial [Kiritimatiellaeota bacterium]|nr:glycosyltransferase [Kiritimatiellota bacterium]